MSLTLLKTEPAPLRRLNQRQFIAYLKSKWFQGEHITLVAQTGSGKTTLAARMLGVRGYVVVLAVKRRDETLELFKEGGYRVIKRWPPEYRYRHVVLWLKPDSLSDDLDKQAKAIHAALNDMYLAGGWCIYFDEVGYLAGTLGLGRDVGVLLNQGRSNHLSVVAAMTRPSSVIARIPKETLNQARHILIGKYTNLDEIETCSKIAGMSRSDMVYYQQELVTYPQEHSDFLYIGKGNLFIVTP